MLTKEDFFMPLRSLLLWFMPFLWHRTLRKDWLPLKVRESSRQKNETSDSSISGSYKDPPFRNKIWRSLPRGEEDSNRKLFLAHEAYGSSRALCSSAVAKICIRHFFQSTLPTQRRWTSLIVQGGMPWFGLVTPWEQCWYHTGIPIRWAVEFVERISEWISWYGILDIW